MIQPLIKRKHSNILLLLIISGAVLFNAIFWEEKLAVNMALFTAFAFATITSVYKDALKNNFAKWLLLAVLCTLLMVIIYNSVISSIACVTTIILFTAYCKYRHRSPVYAIGSALQSFLYFIPQFFTDVKYHATQKTKRKTIFNKLRIVILPISLLILFFFIYQHSSKVFSGLTIRLTDQLEIWAQPVFNWVQPQRILFLLFGLLICGGLLYQHFNASFQKAEALKSDDLKREKNRSKYQENTLWKNFMQLLIGGRAASGSLALKYEYKAGILSLLILNALLILVNTTDILYLWVGRQYEPGFEWAGYVHEGAEMLIVSILMAMLVVLFFFRGNINFLKGKKYLLTLAYIWLLQNAFLTASVCLRNYYYVSHMALTYKRIGLFVFTLLVLAGLISVFLKIRYVKSSYYLIKCNAVTGLAVLVLAAFFQWDVLIANYNFKHKNDVPLDAAFLLTLSDHALPVLQQHRYIFNDIQIPPQRGIYPEYSNGSAITILDDRIKNYLQQQSKYTWLSWNLADANTTKQLLQNTNLSQN